MSEIERVLDILKTELNSSKSNPFFRSDHRDNDKQSSLYLAEYHTKQQKRDRRSSARKSTFARPYKEPFQPHRHHSRKNCKDCQKVMPSFP